MSKYGFHRDFKVYQAEKFDENHQINSKALTPHGNTKYIMVNPQWEYFKVKTRKSLSSSNTYSRRKYDVETVFGNLKAYLGFTRFTVRGLKKVKKQIGIALMALNMKKLAGRSSNFLGEKSKKKDPFENFFNFRMDLLNLGTYVTAPFDGLEITMSIISYCHRFS
ncbi:transposase [Limosilactobacillus reuteri]|uniref:transposase n=1 Tax=Limosilactobacillus reuteri TaxID=1598 RepID=UPI001E3BF759|nr:transposase [Limosilactobacillus reuteri]